MSVALLLSLVLAQPAPAQAEAPPTAERPVRWSAALEAALEAYGPGPDGWLTLTPVAGLAWGEALALELGAPLRLSLLARAPGEASAPGTLRREDWDSPSDLGQVVRALALGAGSDAVQLRAGPLVLGTLGHGHLVSRYTNRANPDYHPAGATLALHAGALRLEALASDVLAGRLFAGELRADLGRWLAGEPGAERAHAALSVAHDAARGAGGPAPALTAAQLDVDAALFREQAVQLFAVGGVGVRPLPEGERHWVDWGWVAGLVLEGSPARVQAGGRLELRRQAGGFRTGLFGPAYELARFSATGLSEPALADERLPRGLSGYAEASFALGREGGEDARLEVSAAVEHYAFGRTDADLAVHLALPGGRAEGLLRLTSLDLETHTRHALGAELRWRLVPALYLVGGLGTQHRALASGGLHPGWTASLGLGADVEG